MFAVSLCSWPGRAAASVPVACGLPTSIQQEALFCPPDGDLSPLQAPSVTPAPFSTCLLWGRRGGPSPSPQPLHGAQQTGHMVDRRCLLIIVCVLPTPVSRTAYGPGHMASCQYLHYLKIILCTSTAVSRVNKTF